MLFSAPVVTVITLALAFSANAQSTTAASSSSASGAPSTTSATGAPAATSALPGCVTQCQASSAITASCVGARDIPCICSIKSRTLYQTAVDSCIRAQCGADADKDIAAANQAQNATCLAFASGLAGKSSASSTGSSSSSSNAAGSVRPLARDSVCALGAALGTVVFGAVFGAAAL